MNKEPWKNIPSKNSTSSNKRKFWLFLLGGGDVPYLEVLKLFLA